MFSRGNSNLGIDLISELGRRGQRGMYFKYAGYRRLRGITTVPELRQFLDDHHYDVVPASNDVTAVAEGFEALTAAEAKKTTWLSILGSFDPLLIVATFPVWIVLVIYWTVWDPKKAAAQSIQDANAARSR